MTKVLIVDDHPVLRTGLKRILENAPEDVVVGEAATGEEALQQVRGYVWDVIVLDVTLPDRSALDLIKQIKSDRPQLPVLALSAHAEPHYVIRMLHGGAAGYLTKEAAPEHLLTAIRELAAGATYLSHPLAQRLVFAMATGRSGVLPHERLSDREFEVLCLLVSGKTVTQTARVLHISVKTVSTHRGRILVKTGLKTTADLIRYALLHQLVP